MEIKHSISDFINGFDGGFRPNRFYVDGDLYSPSASSGGSSSSGQTPANKLTQFHIRSTNLPPSTLTVKQIPYRGRMFKFPGERTYSSWQIVVLDDTNNLWQKFHNWSNAINNHESNKKSSEPNGTGTKTNFTGFMKNWSVKQLDINGTVKKTINLNRCWPSEVGPIILSMDDNETLVTFTVTIEYQYFTVSSP